MHIQKQIDRLQTEQASQWIETLRGGGAHEHAEFCEWLRQSRVHVEEFLEVVAIDRALQDLDLDRRIDVQALIREMSSSVVPIESAAATSASAVRQPRRRRFALAASVAVCALAAGVYWQQRQPDTAVATAAGEQHTMTLEDGSVVTLNGASRIRLAYTGQERNIELLAGEAVFTVARDAVRPFQVHTPTATVRALGTQFNVNQQTSDTVVSVLEGRVRVTTSRASAAQDLGAGEQAQIQSGGYILKKTDPDVARALAWRHRNLRFEDTPLEDIVARINRHSAVKLRLEGIEPGSRRYGGIFDLNDPQSLAAVLEREEDLIVERRVEEILVRRRKAP